MIFSKRWTRNSGFLILLAALVVVLVCLILFGAAFQNIGSDTFMQFPVLWFGGMFVLPVFCYLLLKLVWRRLDRVSR